MRDSCDSVQQKGGLDHQGGAGDLDPETLSLSLQPGRTFQRQCVLGQVGMTLEGAHLGVMSTFPLHPF